MRVPHTSLRPETLRAVLEEFVSREGTEYGERDVALEDKVAAVQGQLEDGSAFLVWNPESETVSIMAAHDVPYIQLDQLLKREGLSDTGGLAKVAIQAGEVRVNGEVETRRKRKLHDGDRVTVGERTVVVRLDAAAGR